uniref:Uncharacterized protein n=1 Tax=Strongyloides papillosus TaxID=174720 RepID=A0A0N5CHA0_STREA
MFYSYRETYKRRKRLRETFEREISGRGEKPNEAMEEDVTDVSEELPLIDNVNIENIDDENVIKRALPQPNKLYTTLDGTRNYLNAEKISLSNEEFTMIWQMEN